MKREEIIDQLNSSNYRDIRLIYSDYKEGVEGYDAEIIDMLRYHPILCFEFGVRTDLEFIPAKWHYIYHIPPGIKEFKNLITLDLSFNFLSKLPDEFGDLDKLEQLGLEKNNFTEIPIILSKLPKLRSINLMQNKITSISTNIHQFSDSLETLFLNNNLISSISENISKLGGLKKLWLNNNPIPESEHEKIKEWLPNTEIHF